MGLDIRVVPDINANAFYTDEFFEKSNLFALSRTFCNFYFTYVNYLEESEFLQVSRIARVDSSILLKMAEYPSPEYVEAMLELEAKTEQEREELIEKFESERIASKQRISYVKTLLSQLYSALEKIDNLPELINYNNGNELRYFEYLNNFGTDKNYVDNNLSQDVRNFIRVLEYAEKQGANYVYFDFG